MKDCIPTNQYAVLADTRERKGFELLEQDAVKVASPVLRGVGLGNGVGLPDARLYK
jgi:hypothetical protein